MNCTRKSGQWEFKLFNRKKEVQKMAKRQIQFTQEQIEILLKNPNVESISSNTIRFTSEFKELAMQKDKEGFPALQIFKDAGFDLDILGKETPKTSIRNWRHREKTLNKSNTKYLAKEVKKNKALKSILEENRYLKAENEFLKKLQALQELAE